MKAAGGAALMAAASLTAAAHQTVRSADPSQAGPQRRESVIDLAYVLGEMHALHRLCAGPDDDTWRAKMARLMQIENPDAAYRQRLTTRFNAGFMAGSAGFPACAPQSQAAERRMAETGRALSRRLAQSTAF